MTSSQPSSGDRPSSAEDAYALLLKLRESGSAPDFETWVRAYPEYERELRALEESWASIEGSLGRLLASTVIVPPEPLVASLEPGLVVGEFTLVRRIGVGGMGVVWLARQPVLDRDVALKFVRPDRETAQSAELFAREARAAGRARDPRIVTIYAVGESAGHRWLAQEYVPGSRGVVHWLRELQDSGVPSDHERRVAAFVADVAEALHGAHLLGVVHRDVKPQNLLMAPDGSPKITDFGLARLLDEVPLSESLTIRGTVEYSSPEQVTGANDQIDARSDVFSLGVVLYELLALERPFTGMGVLEVIAAITVREVKPPSSLRPGLARDLDVIALKALEKQPEARYASALELARDLRRWLAHEPISARPPTILQRLSKWMRRHPSQVSLAGVGVLLLAVTMWGIRWQGVIVEGRKDLHIQRMHFDINDGRMDAARTQAASFLALDDDDPEAHLVLAMGYARFLRFQEADDQLALAAQAGYSPELGPQPTSEDLYRRALWLIAQRETRLHAEAAGLLERAASSQDHKAFVWFPLYQMRKSIGDRAGARAALVEFIDTLRVGDEFTSVAQGLLAELDGDHLRAIGILEDLRASADTSRQRDVRLHRHLGRNYMLEYLARPGERLELLDSAEAALRSAVAESEDDGFCWAALAMVQKLRADLEVDAAERERLRAEAEDFASRATEHGLGLDLGSQVLAMLAFDRLSADFDTEHVDESELDEVERRFATFRDLDPASPLIPILESGVAYYRGAFAQARGDTAEAIGYFEDSVAASERQLYARVKLGQRLVEDHKNDEAAQLLLAEALALWDSARPGVPGEDPTRERKWLLAAAVWLFGAAERNGDLSTAREARDRALRELEADDRGMEFAEMLTLAEYLALAKHSEMKDCELARSLIEERGLEQVFGQHPEGARVLSSIRAACED